MFVKNAEGCIAYKQCFDPTSLKSVVKITLKITAICENRMIYEYKALHTPKL